MPDLHHLRRIAEHEFPDLVRSTAIFRDKLRVVLVDDSYMDFWWSSQIPGRFAHHWERTHVDGTIYRHDNMPHPRWQKVATFPQHFHHGAQHTVGESDLPSDPEAAVRVFLEFARSLLEETEDG